MERQVRNQRNCPVCWLVMEISTVGRKRRNEQKKKTKTQKPESHPHQGELGVVLIIHVMWLCYFERQKPFFS